ncbi:hypothetical protein BD560DRAFT_333613, partial [Blakeslea trispora]
ELNSIEQFWALIKGRVKGNKLQNLETLEKRIVEAAYKIPLQQLHNTTKRSKNQYENCINYKPIQVFSFFFMKFISVMHCYTATQLGPKNFDTSEKHPILA